MEDHHAIARLKRRDIGGLETLVKMYQVRAIRAAYIIVRDRALAEDIVQNAFIQAYDRIGQFDSSRPFEPWFLKIVFNASLKTAARQDRQVSYDPAAVDEDPVWQALLVSGEPGPPDIVENRDVQRAIWDALGRLSPAQRMAVVFRYFLDLNEVEMTARMNRPVGTIKWLLHSARKRMRQLLAVLI